jgi:hypothetical protein
MPLPSGAELSLPQALRGGEYAGAVSGHVAPAKSPSTESGKIQLMDEISVLY